MTSPRTTPTSDLSAGRPPARGPARVAAHTDAARQAPLRIVGRWLTSFAGFPLGGYLAVLAFGPVDTVTAALAGGALTGTVLGAAQAWAFGVHRPPTRAWIGATAVGLAAGLAVGSYVVDYATDLPALMVQGALTGTGVGLAQGVVLVPRLGIAALSWPVALAGLWALGWLVSDAVIGTAVDEHFYIFGSSGALVVTALTAALPLALDRRSLSPAAPATRNDASQS
jgi:hypothetical protein